MLSLRPPSLEPHRVPLQFVVLATVETPWSLLAALLAMCGVHVLHILRRSQTLPTHPYTIQLPRFIRGFIRGSRRDCKPRQSTIFSSDISHIITRQEASVGRQTPSSASKTRTVLNCRAKVAPSSSQSCNVAGRRRCEKKIEKKCGCEKNAG